MKVSRKCLIYLLYCEKIFTAEELSIVQQLESAKDVAVVSAREGALQAAQQLLDAALEDARNAQGSAASEQVTLRQMLATGVEESVYWRERAERSEIAVQVCLVRACC